ncbi:MAG: GNAT family N-acetyltransferase, partial [Planctomycetota bacterium]|nr:GNAT family N-acetyltransferase [Planctomycetota bacterium]
PAAARAKAYGIWCVVSKDDGTHLGDAGLIEKEVDGVAEVEVIYILRPEHWGQGLGTEIATALVAHAFGPRDRARVVALIHPDNAASARVAEKAGLSFDRETVRRGGKTLRVYVRHRTRD